MSRKIKFRAWDKVHKKMIQPTGAYASERYWHIESSNNGYWGMFQGGKRLCGNADESGILLQYTGLKDKYGKGIYEGDVIKYGKEYFVVIWNDGTASFTVDFSKGYKSAPNINRGTMLHVEVVGNIYENPELLEGEE